MTTGLMLKTLGVVQMLGKPVRSAALIVIPGQGCNRRTAALQARLAAIHPGPNTVGHVVQSALRVGGQSIDGLTDRPCPLLDILQIRPRVSLLGGPNRFTPGAHAQSHPQPDEPKPQKSKASPRFPAQLVTGCKTRPIHLRNPFLFASLNGSGRFVQNTQNHLRDHEQPDHAAHKRINRLL
jgi:hypothetical protein